MTKSNDGCSSLLRSLQRGLSATVCLALIGCGGTAGPKLVPAEAVFTMDGKPLANAMVSFQPIEGTKGQTVTGMTDAAGKVALFHAGTAKGAPVGKYKVVVSKLVDKDGADIKTDAETPPIMLVAKGARNAVPKMYSDAQASMLTAEVKEGGPPLTFDLKSPPKGFRK
ncbi:MAG: carboxypeptidase regulatory-like domain-containing protein [Planctomycetia bacterium]